ncbi:MAG: winged helix-turn-helix domain-containing protein [Bacteroidales bacterium]|nr:winged helix-turn-helix domain-containing protein [Bacteroidales bacterium]
MKKNDHAAMKYQILLMLQQEGPLTPTEITERLAGIIGMDDEEFDERYEGRPHDKVFYKSVATNEQHLKAAGLLDFLGKSGHCITFEGIQALMDNETSRQIEYSYLRQFPEYCQWFEKFRKASNLPSPQSPEKELLGL